MRIKYFEMSKKEKIVFISLLSAICLTLIFIWIQSLLPPSVSKEESDAVAGILSAIFPSDGFIINNIRQIAHFAEYGLLGIEVSVFLSMFAKSIVPAWLYSLGFAQLCAFFDETLQLFSGRVADIVDVWTDFLGYLIFSLIAVSTYFCVIKWKTEKET